MQRYCYKEKSSKPLKSLLGKFTFSSIVIYIKYKDIITKEYLHFHQLLYTWNARILLRRKIIQVFKTIAWKIYVSSNRCICKMQRYYYEGKSSKFSKSLLWIFMFPSIVIYVKCKDIMKGNHQNHCFKYLHFHQSLYM